jgi:hypothetical protein
VASCRAMGAHGATLVPADARIPDALQRRRAGDRRLRHRARRASGPPAEGGKKVAVFADETARSCRAHGSPRGNSSRTASTPPSSPTT